MIIFLLHFLLHFIFTTFEYYLNKGHDVWGKNLEINWEKSGNNRKKRENMGIYYAKCYGPKGKKRR